jgi:alkane 1-monooxygenase
MVEEGAPAPVARPGDAERTTEVLAARCPGCGYTYDVVSGDEREGFADCTAWDDVPDTWCCPDCGVRDKADFVPVDASRV